MASLVSVALVVIPWLFLARVAAAPTDVSVIPNAGAVGTTVTVSGSACSPGLFVNPSRARIVGVTLGVDTDVAVPANGAWSVEFVVTANAIESAHTIAATCLKDSLPVPYVPLIFTVTAAPAPSTTLASSTTVTTTVTSGSGTTTVAAAADASGRDANESEGQDPGTRNAAEPPAPAEASTTTAVDRTMTSIARDTSEGAIDVVVSAARSGDDNRRRSLVFGALSPISQGWLRLLVGLLVAAVVVSGVIAILWFQWLRHTRAREWWIRWMNQIVHIRSHARPPR